MVDALPLFGQNLPRGVSRLMDDAATKVIQACLAGNESGAKSLYLQYAGCVGAYLLRSGFSPADVRELTQETFTSAFKSLHTFDSHRGSLRVWLSMIVRDVARRHWSRRKQSEHFDLALAEELFAATADAEDSPEKQEKIEAVRLCAEQLLPQLRNVLRLRYVAGRTVSGISAAIAVPEATVDLQLTQARQQLAGCLRKKGILE